jgi:NADPH2:quinone reductase
VYRRKELSFKRKSPFIAGYEGAGVVVDSNNTEFNVGDRIAFADVPCQFRLVAVQLNMLFLYRMPLVSKYRHHSSSRINRSLSTDGHKTQKEKQYSSMLQLEVGQF